MQAIIRFIVGGYLMCLLIQSSVATTNLIDNPEQLYELSSLEDGGGRVNDKNMLDTKITVRRTFHNIDELVNRLNAIDGVSVSLYSRSSDVATPVAILMNNGTIRQLLNQSTQKLGYVWCIKNHEIVFKAIHPTTQNAAWSSSNPTMGESMPLWVVNRDDKTLRNTLTKWCKRINWQLVWNVKANYPIDTNWSISGNFESAVNEVLKATVHTDMPLMATMYDSNRVLEIYSLSSK